MAEFDFLIHSLLMIFLNGEEVGGGQTAVLSAEESVSIIAPKKCKRVKDDSILRSINFYLLKNILKNKKARTDNFDYSPWDNISFLV